jgi:hypothetical protein
VTIKLAPAAVYYGLLGAGVALFIAAGRIRTLRAGVA